MTHRLGNLCHGAAGRLRRRRRARLGRFHQPADAGPFAWVRGGAGASWDKFENLSGQKDRRRTGWETDVADSPTWRLSRRERGDFALPPAPSRSHPGCVDRASFCGRGGTRAAGPPTSHRSDSPTPTRRVGSGGLWPRKETGESGEEMGSYVEYGAVRRLPMRSAVARGGECGLPHGRTSTVGLEA